MYKRAGHGVRDSLRDPKHCAGSALFLGIGGQHCSFLKETDMSAMKQRLAFATLEAGFWGDEAP